MKKLLLFFSAVFLIVFSLQHTYAQTAPIKAWDKTFGGSDFDACEVVKQTPDGGYILGGSSDSPISGNKTSPKKGNFSDFWIIKLDACGNKLWEKTFGGAGGDALTSIQLTSDGGFILGGYSGSPISGDKSQASQGFSDYWVVKLDMNGNKLWDRTFGGNSDDNLFSIEQTTDGGYILGGFSMSSISGDKSQVARGMEDYWVVRIDSSGNKIWDRTFGGQRNSHSYITALLQTPDGGFLLGGYSNALKAGDKTQPLKGNTDYWIIKMDSNGNKIWDRSIGGSGVEQLVTLNKTSDGGFLLGGDSSSGISGDKTEAAKGLNSSYWIVKIDANGNKLWDKTIGGNVTDAFYYAHETSDGGYILGGTSFSGIGGDKTEASKGKEDIWIVKLDANRNKVWDKTLGGSDIDYCRNMQQTSDRGFIIGGFSYSGISGDKSETSYGLDDFWVIRLNASCSDLNASLAINCSAPGSVQVNISGPQMQTNCLSAWTLTYAENGVVKTVSGSAPSSILTHNAVPGTIYSLISISSGSCTTSLHSIITIQPSPKAPTVASGNECEEEPITLSATGAPNGGKYILYDVVSGGKPLQISSLGSFTIPNVTTSVSYFVSATNGSGCEGSRTEIVVSSKPCPEPFIPNIFIPNIITQNHDTKNDTFKPQNLPEGKWQLQIYNRWGVKVFESKDYHNNWPEKKIASGTYYYLLSNSETGKQFKGWLEVTE